MEDEELKEVLSEIKEFYKNDLQDRKNNACVDKYSEKIHKILNKKSFLPCDAIKVFLWFNCIKEDRPELTLRPKSKDEWIANILQIIRKEKNVNINNRSTIDDFLKKQHSATIGIKI